MRDRALQALDRLVTHGRRVARSGRRQLRDLRVADDHLVACELREGAVDGHAVGRCRPRCRCRCVVAAQHCRHVAGRVDPLDVGGQHDDLLLEVDDLLAVLRDLLLLELAEVALLLLGDLEQVVHLLLRPGALVCEALQTHLRYSLRHGDTSVGVVRIPRRVSL